MKIQRVHTSLHLWLAAAALTAMPAWADGELDKSFSTNGVARLALPVQDISTIKGTIEAAGIWGGSVSVIRLSPAGTVMGSPQISPQSVITRLTALVRDSLTGDIWAAGYRTNTKKFCFGPNQTKCLSGYIYTAQFARFSATGTLIASYEGGNCVGTKMLADESGAIAVCVPKPYFSGSQVVRLNTEGDQLALTEIASFGSLSAGALLRDAASGAYYIGGYACGASQCRIAQYVMRLEAGSLLPDPSYGASGVAQVLSLPIGDVHGMALDSSPRIVIGGSYGAPRPGYDGQLFMSGYLARLTGTGLLDETFRAGGVVRGLPDRVTDVATDVDSNVYALGQILLRRFNVDGGRDPRFASSANAQNLAGGSWTSMRFADSSRSSAYLLGSTASGTSMVAKVLLNSSFAPYLTQTTLRASPTEVSSGQAITFTATVAGNAPTGSVMFMDGTELLTDPVTLNSGTATYSTSALATGSHNISAVYDGDSNNGASASPTVAEMVYVLPVATRTVVSTSAAKITAGDTVTFIATVTGFKPTGTVTFTDGSATLGSAVTLSSGYASLTTSALAAGTHSVAAAYSGDAANTASASQTVIETVKALTKVALSTSAATTTQGETITLTATVTGSDPLGTVAFKDGSTVLATENLVAAGTSYSTPALAVGQHSITAEYSGDDHNAASSSQVVTETVHALPSGGAGGGGSGGGGGGAFTGLELCGMLLLWLGRVFVGRHREERSVLQRVSTSEGDAGKALVTLFIAAFAPTTGHAIEFGSPVSYPVGASPAAVVVADFNGDGKSDLAVANSGSGNISVLIGNGDGTYKPAMNFDAGMASPTSIEVADFNNDGIQDLAVWTLSGPIGSKLSILLGNGNGTFQVPKTIPLPAAVDQATVDLVVADFNLDHKPDLALLVQDANGGTTKIFLLAGKGDGTFQSPQQSSDSLSTASGSSKKYLVTGDFNSDGRPDLAVQVSGAIQILLGQGDGTFHTGAAFPVNSVFDDFKVGDFAGHGNADLLAQYRGSTSCGLVHHGTESIINLYVGNGDGTFQAGQYIDDAKSCPPSPASDIGAPSAGDFNGDGRLDLLYQSSGRSGPDSIEIRLGQNDVIFPVLVPAGGSSGSSPLPWGVTFITKDLNGDKLSDLIYLDSVNGAAVVLLNASPTSGADLGIIESDANSSTYSAVIVNQGPEDATEVTFKNMLPASVTFASATATQGSCTHSAGIVTCAIGSLAPGSEVTVLIPVAMGPNASDGTVTNSMSVSAKEPDSAPADNTAMQNTAVFTVTVQNAGTGSGTVTSKPSGINCGAVCTQHYLSGTSVKLVPTPSAGSTFSGWSGACNSPNASDCGGPISSDKSVTATFDLASDMSTQSGNGGGGAFAGVELCEMLLLWLWRTFVGRRLVAFTAPQAATTRY